MQRVINDVWKFCFVAGKYERHFQSTNRLGLDAEQALKAVRGHWQVETMHWMLDMTFREDECRIRKGNGALAFNALRKIALNLFKFDTTKKISMARKKKNAALNDEYRSVLLESAIKMR